MFFEDSRRSECEFRYLGTEVLALTNCVCYICCCFVWTPYYPLFNHPVKWIGWKQESMPASQGFKWVTFIPLLWKVVCVILNQGKWLNQWGFETLNFKSRNQLSTRLLRHSRLGGSIWKVKTVKLGDGIHLPTLVSRGQYKHFIPQLLAAVSMGSG